MLCLFFSSRVIQVFLKDVLGDFRLKMSLLLFFVYFVKF